MRCSHARASAAIARRSINTSNAKPGWLFPSSSHPAPRTPPRRKGGRPPIQSALGLRHHHLQALVRPKTPAGRHHRLCRPHGHGLEITGAADRLGCLRTPPRSPVSTLCPTNTPSQRPGVPHRQWARVHLGSTPAVVNTARLDRLSPALSQSSIQWFGRVLLRQLQTGLPLAPTFGNFGRGHEARPRLDYTLQRSRASQRSGHVVSSHFRSTIIDKITCKNYINPCPVLTGSHHFLTFKHILDSILFK